MVRFVIRLVPFLAGLAIAVGVAGGVFGLAQTLTKPRSELQLAANVVGELRWDDSAIARVRLGSSSFLVSCQPWPHGYSVVTIGDRPRLLVTRTQVRLFGRAVLGGSAAVAISDLAGCPRVLSRLLTARIRAALSHDGVVPLRRHGSSYWIPLTARLPLVVLEVNRRTLEPVGVRFRGRVLNGASQFRQVERRKVVA